MSTENTREKTPDLQFDRAVSGSADQGGESAASVQCAVCKRSIDSEYFHANSATVCRDCARQVQIDATTAKGSGPLLRALLFGLGAAIAGAIVYYAVIAITGLEIGIVAILIGYMVGYAVRKGMRGRGGRRFQILAVVLTYWAVGLAYTPLAMKELTSGDKSKAAVSKPTDSANVVVDSTEAAAVNTKAPAAADSTKAKSSKAMSPGLALVILMGLVFALPILSIVGSMPGGLISAFIIFIGLQQAWRMTGAMRLEISGPYKIGGQTPATG